MTLLFRSLLAAVLSVSLFAHAIPSPNDISYDSKQSATAVEVVYRLYASQYNKQRLDDDLSQVFLDKYIEMLDPSRMFFYAKDIEGFSRHSKKFDDYFREGNLDAAYEIYHVYQTRVTSRLESVAELIEDETVTFSFDSDDKIELDRKEAPWARSTGELDELWHKRIKLSLLNLKLASKELSEARKTVAKRYQNQLNRIKQETSQDVFEIVLNALALLYDPHTAYWSPRTTENFNINMSKSLEGIGAVLQTEDEFTKIVRLVAGGPAARDGQLHAADRVVSVGQGEKGELVDIIGWRLDEVVQLIRGPKNTVVRLEVLPSTSSVGDDTTIIKINRGKVKLEDQAAQKAILELPGKDKVYKLGVIQLPDFYVDFEAYAKRDPNYKSSSRDVSRLLDQLEHENIDGLVLDLRNNGGGSLHEATMLTDLFINRGVVVQIKSSDGRVGRQNQAFQKPKYNGPLIVLINRLSASASEIFAGAIQDYGRGIIIGSQSFGKGTVQSVKDLKLGQLKVTESKFYRVSGESTQHRGVIPDLEFPSMLNKEDVGESSYENALVWDQIHSVPHQIYNDFTNIIPALTEKHSTRVKSDPDFNFLLDQIALVKANQSEKFISLNEKARIARKDSLQAQSMQIENKRKVAKGEKPYKDLAAFKAKEKEDEDARDDTPPEPSKIDVDGDTLLIESGNVIIDFIELSSSAANEQIAKVK